MDNDYIIKLGPEAFNLLYDIIEEQVSGLTAPTDYIKAQNVPLLEAWVALQRADKEHHCVDEGHHLLVLI